MLAGMGGILESSGASGPLGVQVTDVNYTTGSDVDNPSIAGIQFKSDNTILRCGSDGVYDITVDDPYVVNGALTEVWMQRTITAGSLTTDDIGASRVTCNATYEMDKRDTNPSLGAPSVSFTVYFYDDPTAGNLLGSADYTIKAEYNPFV
jgi:hypothetical protein